MIAARPTDATRDPGVTIGAVNPLDHEREIKELFLSHGRPEFPGFFDRTYPRAVADGATSWLGRNAEGRVVMHIACLRRRFRFGDQDVAAGLLANLVVAREHRSFFPAVALVHRLIVDSRLSGLIDFLYADPNDESRALLRAIRFGRAGTLRRYVLPGRARRSIMDLGVRLFHAVLRGTAVAARRERVVASPAGQVRPEAFAAPPPVVGRLTAYHECSLYQSRLLGYPGERDWWLIGAHVGLLIRGPDAGGLATLHAVRRSSALPLAAVLPELIAELRRRGCDRLQVMAMAESDLGRTLRRCGFMPRRETVPLYALPLTPQGEACITAGTDWEITDLDCDR